MGCGGPYNGGMRIIAMINQKGGVGKTTTVANLASALASRGLQIGLIDMDPQSHLTIHFGVEPGTPELGTYEVLADGASLAEAMVSVEERVRLVPASIDLAGAEIELVSTVGREQLLADRFREAALELDYVLMDCPPSLGLLTLNALAAADEVIIPLQPHFLALQGLGKLLETVALVQKRINPRLRVLGVVFCMFESSTRLAGEVVDDVERFLTAQNDPASPWCGAKLFETRIRRNIKLAEAPSFGKTIFYYEPYSHGATDYDCLAEEFLQMHQHVAGDLPVPPPQPVADSPRPQPAAPQPREEAAPTPPTPPAPPSQPQPAAPAQIVDASGEGDAPVAGSATRGQHHEPRGGS